MSLQMHVDGPDKISWTCWSPNPSWRLDFWVVWNPKGGNPTARHATQLEAQQEAERLSKKCPGDEFFVLHAERKITTPKAATVVSFL